MRHSLLISCAIVLGSAIVALFGPKSQAQPAAQQAVPGRYQIVATDRQGANARVVLCDTTTGHCWEHRIDVRPWADLGSPFAAAKKGE